VNLVDLTSDASDTSDIEDLPPAVVTAAPISNSAPSEKVDLIKIRHLLKQHQHRVITSVDEEDVQRIHVRRSHIFADSFRHFSKESFDVSKMLKVVFVGECAIDDGGPRREYFQLLLHAIACHSGLFGGWPNHVVPLHNIDALSRSKFFVIGKMLATALVQGGQPPVYFACPVADFLVFDRVRSPVDLDDIDDFDVRQSLQKVYIVCMCFTVII
jgi:hypothetical protein